MFICNNRFVENDQVNQSTQSKHIYGWSNKAYTLKQKNILRLNTLTLPLSDQKHLIDSRH